MLNVRPPFRLVIGNLMLEGKAYNAQDIYNALEKDYKNEKQLNVGDIEDHLQSMKGVGILKIYNEYVDSQGLLIQSYTLTEYGVNKVNAYL